MSAHYVYHVYDISGDLIYVGCTSNLFARLRAHQTTSWWAHQGAHVVAKVYPQRFIAFDVERKAIQSGHPRWNLNGHKLPIHWTRDQYADFVTSYLNQPGDLTTPSWNRLRSMARRYQLQFGEDLAIPFPDEIAS